MNFSLSKSRIVDVAFYTMTFSIIVSLNSLVYLLFGINQVASPIILLCSATILTLLGISRKSFDNTGIKLLYATLAFYAVLGTIVRLHSIDIEYRVSIFYVINNFLTSLVVIMAVHQYGYNRMIKERKEPIFFNAIYLPILISVFYAVYQSLTGQVSLRGDDSGGRILGLYGNPNILGYVANLFLVLTIYTIYKHKKYTIIKFPLLLTAVYVSILSGSRTAMATAVAIILFSIVWLTFNFSRTSSGVKFKYIFVAGIPIFLMTLFVTQFDYILDNYATYSQAKRIRLLKALAVDGEVTGKTTAGRTHVVEFGLNRISESPIIGHGGGYFVNFPSKYGFEHGIHNTYLLVFGDAGVFAFLLMISFILYIWIRSLVLSPLIALIAIGCVLVWAMQCIGSHNGLNDKIMNIQIMTAAIYVMYGLSGQSVPIKKLA